MSEYLEAHRDIYYSCLRNISQDGNWNGWIEFFLDAVVEQARANTARVQAINSLYGHMKVQITELTRSPHAMAVLDTLFDRRSSSPRFCGTFRHSQADRFAHPPQAP